MVSAFIKFFKFTIRNDGQFIDSKLRLKNQQSPASWGRVFKITNQMFNVASTSSASSASTICKCDKHVSNASGTDMDNNIINVKYSR